MSSSEIAYKVESSTGNTVAPRTVQRTLTKMQYDRKKPRNVPMLTKRHVEARLKFAQDNLDRDWTKVLFSEESFVQLFSNGLTLWTRKGTTRVNPQIKDRTKVYKQYFKMKKELKEILVREWEYIDQYTIANLVNSMKNRCLEVIRNQGKRINY